MNNNSVLVSVIIPTFNSERYIAETIESVLQQTHPNVEIICVDDGSSDNTKGVVKKMQSQNNCIIWLTRGREPKGGSTCRNIGARIAKGKYLIFLDSDDVLSTNCIENRLNVIMNTDYKFVVFPMASFSDTIQQWSMTSRLNVKDFKYFFASGFAAWQVTSPIWEKNFFLNVINGFDESFQRLQDIELHLRAIVNAGNNYLVSKDNLPDCFYRKTSSTNAQHDKMIRTLYSYEKFATLLDHLYQDGKMGNHKKFSASILVMYLTMICTVRLLNKADVYDYKFERINSISIYHHMLWYDKLLFKISSSITNPTLGSFIARGLRILCQFRFY